MFDGNTGTAVDMAYIAIDRFGGFGTPGATGKAYSALKSAGYNQAAQIVRQMHKTYNRNKKR